MKAMLTAKKTVTAITTLLLLMSKYNKGSWAQAVMIMRNAVDFQVAVNFLCSAPLSEALCIAYLGLPDIDLRLCQRIGVITDTCTRVGDEALIIFTTVPYVRLCFFCRTPPSEGLVCVVLDEAVLCKTGAALLLATRRAALLRL